MVVGGGSTAGLSFAMEAASRGASVLVLEEDKQIGEPEKCDGLVSQRALDRYFPPSARSIQSRVKRGVVYSPSGRSVYLDAVKLGVIVIDRSAYDQELAAEASSRGAAITTGMRVTGTREVDGSVRVTASPSSDSTSKEYTCSYFVDATGPAGVIERNRSGLIPAAKYEVEGDWFREGDVEVHLDQRKYPGFFAWVIPRGDGTAKVGAAGVGINSFKTLDSFLEGKPSRIKSRVASPIYIGGPLKEFTKGRTLYVGESAGQVKPTTAGGILGSVAAGTMAGRWVAESVRSTDIRLLANYQRDWDAEFGNEFRLMLRLRHVFEHLSNEDLDKMAGALSSPGVSAKLASADFDFHASSLVSALGARTTIQLAGVLISVEAKRALSSLVQQ